MRSYALIVAAAFSLAIQAAAQTGETTATTGYVRVSAELAKKLDTKDAKPGDEVAARTTSEALLGDSTILPKGTRLSGTVIEVHAKSSTENIGHVAFSLNRATLPDGHVIPLHVTLISLSAPGQMNEPAQAATGVPSMIPSAEAGSGSTGSSGGIGSGMDSGLGVPAGSRKTKGTGRAANPAAGMDAADAVAPPVRVRNDPRAESGSAASTYVSEALKVHRYPVGNMPGVMLSSQASASISAWVDANGQNVRLESGMKMTMNVSIAAR